MKSLGIAIAVLLFSNLARSRRAYPGRLAFATMVQRVSGRGQFIRVPMSLNYTKPSINPINPAGTRHCSELSVLLSYTVRYGVVYGALAVRAGFPTVRSRTLKSTDHGSAWL
jgi:hypothetical protein